MQDYQQHFEHKLNIYQQAMAHAGVDSIVIDSGRAATAFQDDLDYPYKANAYFKEWLPIGVNQNAFLLIRLGAKPTVYFHRPMDYWHSAPHLPDASMLAHFEVIEFSDVVELSGLGHTAYVGELAAEANHRLKLLNTDALEQNNEQVLNFIDYHRAWKTAYELEQMREANRLAVLGHRAAETAFNNDCSELEIHLAYLKAVVAKDSELPYDSIVALNDNAAVLHHMLLSAQRPTNQLSMLIDAGADCAGYAADISRSYAIQNLAEKSVPAHQQGWELHTELCRAVDQAQLKLVELVAENVDYTDIHIQTHRAVATTLSDLKIVNCSAEQAYDSGLTRIFLPHGVGHLLGVQVHDRGGHLASVSGELKSPPAEYPALRCTRIIEENMVFTIEPGVYFIPQLLTACDQPSLLNQTVIEALSPFGGVRIEDNVVATKGVPENMTRDAFAAASQLN